MSSIILLVSALVIAFSCLMLCLIVEKRRGKFVACVLTVISVAGAILCAVQIGSSSANEKWVREVTRDVDAQTIAENKGDFSIHCNIIFSYENSHFKEARLVSDSSVLIEEDTE